MTGRLHFHFSLSCIGGGNGNPLQCSCLENPRDGGAWWAAVYRVAQSRTQLKRLSSSSILCLNILLKSISLASFPFIFPSRGMGELRITHTVERFTEVKANWFLCFREEEPQARELNPK